MAENEFYLFFCQKIRYLNLRQQKAAVSSPLSCPLGVLSVFAVQSLSLKNLFGAAGSGL